MLFNKKSIFDKEEKEIDRVSDILVNTPIILDTLDEQFCKATGLQPTDIGLLFLAAGLQMVRQYWLTSFTFSDGRLGDKEAAKLVKGDHKEISFRKHRLYNPSFDEILVSPVPFDANIGSNGALKGGGFLGHRVKTLGHDPLLGIVFGTSNIATSTLTTSDLKSYHIKTIDKRDTFTNNARTDLVLSKTKDKLIHKGMEGKRIVALSLAKEIQHLRSDVNSKKSLPLPIIPVVDAKFASDLAKYGLDMANINTFSMQISYSVFIDSMISMIHRMMYDESLGISRKYYEIRTRKIIAYSNAISSASNTAFVAATKKIDKFDAGGIGKSVFQLINTKKYITQVKNDAIFGKYDEMIKGYL